MSEINHTRRSLLSSIFDNSNDIRPYANVLIFGRNYAGLLDTGAAISCFGSNAAKEIVKSVQNFKRIKSFVRTADGKSQDVCGYIETDVTFRGVTECIRFYIVPNLAQDLYLGIDLNYYPQDFYQA